MAFNIFDGILAGSLFELTFKPTILRIGLLPEVLLFLVKGFIDFTRFQKDGLTFVVADAFVLRVNVDFTRFQKVGVAG